MLIIRTRAHLPIETRDRFEIVVEHIRWRLTQPFERYFNAAAKIWNQYFYAGFRRPLPNRHNAFTKMCGAAITQIVTVDRSYNHILESHGFDGASKVGGLLCIERVWPTVCHVAERTTTCADVAHDHKSRGALAEALGNIRTACFLADRVEPVLPQNLLELLNCRCRRRANSYPIGLAQRRDGRFDLDRYSCHLFCRRHLGARFEAAGPVVGGVRHKNESVVYSLERLVNGQRSTVNGET